MRLFCWAIVFVVGATIASCSTGSTSDSDVAATAVEPTATATATATETPTPSGQATPAPTAAPARPGPESTGDVPNNEVWLGRGEMTASSIQLYWSEYEAAETYQLHRVVADDVDPRDVVLGEATLLTSSAAIGFVDTAVVAGAQYYYFLIVDTPAGPTAPRWTEAHAVTDVTAPSKITGLEASVTEEGIELTWDRSADNYLFARYAIRRAEDDGESIYYGTGWAIDQTTFIDDRPPQTAATVTYEVIATDFHANTAEPTVITVALR